MDTGILSVLGSTLTQVISWIGSVITALVGDSGAFKALMPLVFIGVALALIFAGVRAIRKLVWGM